MSQRRLLVLTHASDGCDSPSVFGGTTMVAARYDILGLGNAIVDVIAQVPDSFIATHRLVKGTMALIDEEPAEALLTVMGATTTVSGGSAANTVIGAAHLGCRTCFLGRVKNDKLGGLFTEGIRLAGVDFPVPHATTGSTTGRCFILVTPDGQRTMNTYLGACQDLSEGDIDAATGRRVSGRLPRGLSLGPAAREGRLRQGRRDRPCGWAARGVEPLRRVLRRPLP